MKVIFVAIALVGVVFGTSIQDKIQSTNSKLGNSNALYDITYKEFSKLSKKIITEKANLKAIQKKINANSKNLISQKTKIRKAQKKQEQIKAQRDQALEAMAKIQKDFIAHISKNLSMVFATHQMPIQDQNSIIDAILLQRFTSITDTQIETITARIQNHQKAIKDYDDQLQKANTYLNAINKKLQQLESLLQQRNTTIKALNQKLTRYETKIKRIDQDKVYLQGLLSRLKIKEQEAQAAQKEAQRQEKLKQEKLKARRLAEQKQAQRAASSETTSSVTQMPTLQDPSVDIKHLASSYQKVKTTAYKGKKTIAPLSDFTVASKFGSQYDKVYNIKTFNEFVVLSSAKANQKVKAVLAGTIIFADDTPTLNKTIIIEHSNGVHTIYANLSQIAPSIKQGRTVPKGYTIGRIKNELTFEVIKKNRYINPLDFIATS